MQKIDQNISKRVAFYIRVSTEDQLEKYGPEAQRASLEALLKVKKLPDGNDALTFAGEQYVYLDGISGTLELEDRPGFNRLIEDIRNAPIGQRPFDTIAVYKVDRLARKLSILLKTIQFFEDNNIELLSVNESIDTTTPFGKAILGIMGVIAELEIETIKLRMTDGRKRAVNNGVVMGSQAYFGYKKDENKRLAIPEEEANHVRHIFHLFVFEQKSVEQIASILSGNEILSPDASAIKYKKRRGTMKKRNDAFHWRAEKVRQILGDEIYIGNYYYHKHEKKLELSRADWLLSDYHHESIIDVPIFVQSQERLRQLKHSRPVSTAIKHQYLLSGLLKCATCADTIDGKTNMITWIGDRKEVEKGGGNYIYSYKCGRKAGTKYSKKCTVLPFPAKEIENYVFHYLKDLIDDPLPVFEYQKSLKSTQKRIQQNKKELEQIRMALNKLPNRRENLSRQHELSLIDESVLLESVKKMTIESENLMKRKQEIEQRMASDTMTDGYIKVFQTFKEKYQKMIEEDLLTNPSFQFDVIHMMVDEIIVHSRDVTAQDKVAGKKKLNQKMPDRIEIKLRLPQSILNKLATKFVVETPHL